MKRVTKFATAVVTAFLAAAMLATGASAHDNGVGKTPPMGWSSWNAFWANIDEDLIVDTADAMVEHGLKDVGYEYVNLDDNWQSSERDVNGRLQFDPIRFPHDGNWLSQQLHDKGLKVGLYTSNGLFTCQDMPASEFRELSDATSFAEWEIDYFKYDYCHNVQLSTTAYGIHGLKIAKPYAPGTEIYSYEAKDAKLEGTAVLKGNYIDGLGENAGFATFTVNVPEAGAYALNLDFYKKPSSTEVPMFITINGDDRHPYRMMLPATGYTDGAPGSRAAAMLELNAGENTLKFYNPIRSSNRDYDTARYNYGFMRDNLMQATEKYAAENGKENRPIAFSICEWGGRQPWVWGGQTGNLWRTTGDISASWSSVMSIYDVNVNLYQYAGRYGKEDGDYDYGWNDPDMLEVGNGSLTHDENVSHFSLWCQMASPLILGNDLRKLDNESEVLEIIKNEDAIAINQDPTAIQGIKFKDDGDLEYLVKPLTDGRVSLLMFNRSGEDATMSMEISQIGDLVRDKDETYYENYYNLDKTAVYHLKDVWEKNEDGANVEFDSPVASAVVPSHGVKMYIVSPGEEVDKAVYVIGSLSKTRLKSGESAVLTAKLVNGGKTTVENASLSLKLPEGVTAKALSSTVANNLATGDSLEAQYRITAGNVSLTNEPLIVSALLLYEGDRQPATAEFKASVSVENVDPGDPLEDGPLTIHNWVSGKSGWGTIRQDRSINGNTLTIAGTTYPTGIGTHANSELVYFVGGRNVQFTALCGSDDDSGGNGDIRFYVYGDDELLFDSGVMKWKSAAKPIDIKVMNHDYLRLVVDSCGNMDFDHADWIDPQIASYEPTTVLDGILTVKNALSVSSYWKDAVDGKNQDGGPLMLGGIDYSRPDGGFQVNAPGQAIYYIDGAAGVFTAKIGLGDEVLENAGKGATVNYKVYGDNDLLYEQYMDAYSDPIDVEVPMAGYKFLKLVVEEVESTLYDHACWVEPRFKASVNLLANMIDEAEEKLASTGNVSRDAADALRAAIDNAQAIVDKGSDATAEEIASAAKELREAMRKFDSATYVVDKSGLYGAIILAKCINEEDYDAAEWAAFKKVYDASYEVYLKEGASQEEVDKAEEKLRRAMKDLDWVANDLNGDGKLDQKDIDILRGYIAGTVELTDEQLLLADYDGNGIVDVRDLIKWKQYLANHGG
ncbi:NPCBM/NEW2 domain-containing protein [Clostridium sp. D33t1_170424_F3]|uniref:NPCBM/NEW2 domain-containing protein n=1 Tax=Clostridium sp. D33t1_170424_F3 TaxID=2787099 RepID=UPI0018AC8A72